MSPGARKLFGIASFLPMLGIFAMVAWLLAHPEMDRVMDFDWSAAKRVSTSTWIQLGVLLGGVTFLQIGMGAVVGIHVEKRTDMTVGTKIAWTLVAVFVGSIGLPVF